MLNFKILTLFSLIVLSTNTAAGFWSNVIGTAVGNELSSPSSGNSNKATIDATINEKKIQQVLTKLGFYNAKINGNLNSFDTRSAIEDFQIYYVISDSGVLNDDEKNNLLYMHDLLKNYKLELKSPKEKNNKRLKKIFKAFDKLEKKISGKSLTKPLMSSKFKEEIKNRRLLLIKQRKAAKQKKAAKQTKLAASKERKRLALWNSKEAFVDEENNLVWVDSAFKKREWVPAKKHCSNLAFAGSKNWRLPTYKELFYLSEYQKKLKYGTVGNGSPIYWSSSTNTEGAPYYVNIVKPFKKAWYKNREFTVRCVRSK